MENTTVQTSAGAVKGFRSGDVYVWKGVPFAKPPVGDLRFQPPQPMEPWTDVRNAREAGPSAHQPKQQLLAGLTGSPKLKESEDCLYLNIWSPGPDGQKRPVMVWIHGGAYVTGSGSIAWYDGTSFAKMGDVVVVTVNYRLGALGFLHLTDLFGEGFAGSGNLGLLDQIAALQWVHDNIEAFGGDPARVTIFGESAGAGSVGTLLAAPGARGLFQQAIMESGSGGLGVHRPETATETAKQVLARVGVSIGDREALMAASAEELAEAGAALGSGLRFGPVIDGVVLKEHPLVALDAGCAKDIPILTGVNLEEYRLFTVADPGWITADEPTLRKRVAAVLGSVPEGLIDFYNETMPGSTMYERMLPMLTYGVFVRSMLQTVDRQTEQRGAPVYAYRFDWKSSALEGRLGACHALEIPFVFNNLRQLGVERFTGDSEERGPIALAMHKAWIAFAQTGNPNHPDLPEWPVYDFDRRTMMVFDVQTQALDDPYGSERQAWSDTTGGSR